MLSEPTGVGSAFDWAGLAGLIISGILGAMKIHDKYFTKPKLSIQFENDPTIDTTVYRRELEYVTGINADGTHTSFFRRHLNVRVLNTGNAVAHRCRAELTIRRREGTAWVPDPRPMTLTWSGPTQRIDVGAKDREPLMVVMSDSRLQSDRPDEGRPYALAVTLESFNNQELRFVRMQDALGHGVFDATLTVRCDEGVSSTAAFEITVDNNWHNLDMRKID